MKREMRRGDRATSREEARDLLRSAQVGFLSTASPAGEPYGVPINFAFVDDSIYFHCAREGRKLDHLRQNNRVSFCVVGETAVLPAQFAMRYRSTIVDGAAFELSGEAKRQGLIALIEKYSPGYIDEGLRTIENDGEKTRVYRIAIDSISGKARR